MDKTVISDGELLNRFVECGDRGAFAHIVRRHGKMVQRVCSRVTGSTQDGEDASQMVFTTLMARSSLLRERNSLAGWLHWTAWHIAMRKRRDEQTRRRAHISSATVVKHSTVNGREVEVLCVEVDRALGLLPEGYRELLILHHVEGLSVEQAARQVGCPVGTAASRLSRGRAMLKTKLIERGVLIEVAVLVSILEEEHLNGVPPSNESLQAWRHEIATPAAVSGRAVLFRELGCRSSALSSMCEIHRSMISSSAQICAPSGGIGGTWISAKIKVAVVVAMIGGAATPTGRCLAQNGWEIFNFSGAGTSSNAALKVAEPDEWLSPGIQFFSSRQQNTQVPEPTSLSGIVIGGWALLRRRTRRN